MGISLTDEKVAVVLLGSFDPDAALPEKLANAGAIRADEATEAKYRALLQGQVADYSLGWCNISAVRDRFTVESSQPPYVKIADLILKTLAELMPNAVLTKIGINRHYKMKFPDSETRDDLGTRLVPPAQWGDWGKQISNRIEANHATHHGGMVQVTMREGPIEGREMGWRDVQIVAEQ